MKTDNVIQSKSFTFALKIIDLYKYLTNEKKEFILSKQIMRSGTSIGANVEEAIGGFSKNEFGYKLSISYKEARETRYWLKLLIESKYLENYDYLDLQNELDEILKILTSILNKTRN